MGPLTLSHVIPVVNAAAKRQLRIFLFCDSTICAVKIRMIAVVSVSVLRDTKSVPQPCVNSVSTQVTIHFQRKTLQHFWVWVLAYPCVPTVLLFIIGNNHWIHISITGSPQKHVIKYFHFSKPCHVKELQLGKLLQFHWYHSTRWISATILHPAHQNTHTFKCQTSHLQRCLTIPQNWTMVQLIISFFWQQMTLVSFEWLFRHYAHQLHIP